MEALLGAWPCGVHRVRKIVRRGGWVTDTTGGLRRLGSLFNRGSSSPDQLRWSSRAGAQTRRCWIPADHSHADDPRNVTPISLAQAAVFTRGCIPTSLLLLAHVVRGLAEMKESRNLIKSFLQNLGDQVVLFGWIVVCETCIVRNPEFNCLMGRAWNWSLPRSAACGWLPVLEVSTPYLRFMWHVLRRRQR